MSNLEQERNTVLPLLIPFVFIFFTALVTHYCFAYEFFGPTLYDIPFLTKIMVKITPLLLHLKLTSITLFGLLVWLGNKSRKEKPTKTKIIALLAFTFFITPFLIGYQFHIPTMRYAYLPLFILSHIPLYIVITSFASGKSLYNKEEFKQINTESKPIHFSIPTQYGLHKIKNIFSGIFIGGGPGSGKSASIIKRFLWQAVEQSLAGFNYDYEGNPYEISEKDPDDSAPVLSNVIYTAFIHFKPKDLTFAFINFKDFTRTNRCNPILPEYIPDKESCSSIALTTLLNLNEDWKQKIDFWGENAIATLTGMIRYQSLHQPEKCTLPHVIALLLTDFNACLEMLSRDTYIAADMQPVIAPFKMGAGNQSAGVQSSLQSPLAKLNTSMMFWVLSAMPDDAYYISLDVSNPNNKTLLSVGNDPTTSKTLAAPIGTIASSVIRNQNTLNKAPSIFCADELPTTFFKELEFLPAVARKKQVATITAVQTFKQLEKAYGKDNAEIVRDNLMNYIQGSTPNSETAKRITDEIGKETIVDENTTRGDSFSESTSKREKDIFKLRDIKSQPIGHFFFKTNGADQPYLFAQTDVFKPDIPVQEIPMFSIPFDHDGLEEAQIRKIMKKVVDDNYERIFTEAQEQLAEFIEEEEPTID